MISSIAQFFPLAQKCLFRNGLSKSEYKQGSHMEWGFYVSCNFLTASTSLKFFPSYLLKKTCCNLDLGDYVLLVLYSMSCTLCIMKLDLEGWLNSGSFLFDKRTSCCIILLAHWIEWLTFSHVKFDQWVQMLSAKFIPYKVCHQTFTLLTT